MAKNKSNFEILKENKSNVLQFADTIHAKGEGTEDIGLKLQQVKQYVKDQDLKSAIEMLDEIKDNKIGIFWYKSDDLGNNTKALVRDARFVTKNTTSLQEDAGEKYAMQILNNIRAAIGLITLESAKKDLEIEALMQLAINAIDNIDDLPKTIKQYNTDTVKLLRQAGIQDASNKLIFAKEMANFQDEHKHIVTLTNAKDTKNQTHTVIEAAIMLNGLTEEQKAQFVAIFQTTPEKPLAQLPKMEWYNNMPKYKQDLLRAVAADIATGNKVIPTQLLGDIPGIKNAYQKVTAVRSLDQSTSTIISQTIHCGTPATKIKITNKTEKQGIVDEQVKQLQTFIPHDESINLNILTSKILFNPRGENFIQDQLTKTAKTVKNVKISASPINRWRLLGGGRDHSEFRDTLQDIGTDLTKNNIAKNVGKFLKNGSSIFENLAEKIPFLGYKSTKTKAKEEIMELKKTNPQLSNILNESMKTRNLLDSNVMFTRGNYNLKVDVAMNIIENAVKLETSALNGILNKETVRKVSNRVDFCKSGKDRTGYLQTKNTHGSVSSYLGVDPSSEIGQANMLSQVAGGHTQEMAGIQGGSIGCHSIKTNPEFGLSSDPQDRIIEGIINQKSSHFNSKIKVLDSNSKIIKYKDQQIKAKPHEDKVLSTIHPKVQPKNAPPSFVDKLNQSRKKSHSNYIGQ